MGSRMVGLFFFFLFFWGGRLSRTRFEFSSFFLFRSSHKKPNRGLDGIGGVGGQRPKGAGLGQL